MGNRYTNNNRQIESVRMTLDNQYECVEALLKHVSAGRINKFQLLKDNVTSEYTVTFRYTGTSTDIVITVGDYLIRRASGDFTMLTADEFHSKYELQE